MTAEQVKSEIERLTGRDFARDLAPLAERLRQTESATAFRALFPFAAHSQELGPAAPAAWLLLEVNPKCPITLREAVGELLSDWDISIEEVPFYLAEQFGAEAVSQVVTELRSGAGKTQRTILDTIEYWLGCYQSMLGDEKQDGPV